MKQHHCCISAGSCCWKHRIALVSIREAGAPPCVSTLPGVGGGYGSSSIDRQSSSALSLWGSSWAPKLPHTDRWGGLLAAPCPLLPPLCYNGDGHACCAWSRPSPPPKGVPGACVALTKLPLPPAAVSSSPAPPAPSPGLMQVLFVPLATPQLAQGSQLSAPSLAEAAGAGTHAVAAGV